MYAPNLDKGAEPIEELVGGAARDHRHQAEAASGFFEKFPYPFNRTGFPGEMHDLGQSPIEIQEQARSLGSSDEGQQVI